MKMPASGATVWRRSSTLKRWDMSEDIATKAERAALEAIPPDVVKTMYGEFDANASARAFFYRGYLKALKDMGVEDGVGGQNL